MKRLSTFAGERVDLLLVLAGAERRGHQRLGLAAREQRRAVRRAGARPTSQVIGRMSVVPRPSMRLPVVEHQLAHGASSSARLERPRRPRRRRSGNVCGQRGLDRLAARGVERRVALVLLADGHRRARSSGWRSPRRVAAIAGSLAGGTNVALRLADRGAQLLLQVEERLRRLVREHERVDDRRPRSTSARAALDHHDRVAAGGDDQVEVRRLRAAAKVGLTTNLPSMRPTRTPANGPAHGMSEMCSAADAPVIASTSVAFSLVGRERRWR